MAKIAFNDINTLRPISLFLFLSLSSFPCFELNFFSLFSSFSKFRSFTFSIHLFRLFSSIAPPPISLPLIFPHNPRCHLISLYLCKSLLNSLTELLRAKWHRMRLSFSSHFLLVCLSACLHGFLIKAWLRATYLISFTVRRVILYS